MKDINIDFQAARDKSILFLGKFHSLTSEELTQFLEKFNITYTNTLQDDTAMFVEGTIMSPLEEDIAYDAFKKEIPGYSTDQFEKLYANALNSDSLLMSLKLSKNQERLSRLLHNNHLDDSLFIKLFRMVDWGDEGLFDNSENMEASTLFAKRFYYKDRFDPATYYSPISIFEIAIMHDDPEVLETLFSMPDIEVKQSRSRERRPTTIKEALATNAALNQTTLQKLVRLRDPNVDYFLSLNPLIDDNIAQTLLSRGDEETKQALAQNVSISDDIFAVLSKEPDVLEALLAFQKIDMKRFNLIENFHPSIGENVLLSSEVVDTLITQNDEQTVQNLSANESLSSEQLTKIYDKGDSTNDAYLASNRNLPVEMLETLYEKDKREIELSLALNPSTPMKILELLFSKDDFEINQSLALNVALPIEYLQQLQLDTRLMHILKENKTFTENILQGLGI